MSSRLWHSPSISELFTASDAMKSIIAFTFPDSGMLSISPAGSSFPREHASAFSSTMLSFRVKAGRSSLCQMHFMGICSRAVRAAGCVRFPAFRLRPDSARLPAGRPPLRHAVPAAAASGMGPRREPPPRGPSSRAAAAALAVTLAAVMNMSTTRSTAIRIPMPATGRPRDS